MGRDYEIDLKWSLWQEAYYGIAEYAPEAIAAAKAAFEGGEPVTIKTAPKKKIRFGTIAFTEGCAEVHFWYEWDEPWDHLDRVVEVFGGPLSPAVANRCVQLISEWLSEATCSVVVEIGAPSFEQLLIYIDRVEEQLLELERRNSEAFGKYLDAMAERILATGSPEPEPPEE